MQRRKRKKHLVVHLKKAASTDINAFALDIRVGKIVKVWEHEESESLWCEEVDLNEREPRQILSSLQKNFCSLIIQRHPCTMDQLSTGKKGLRVMEMGIMKKGMIRILSKIYQVHNYVV